MYTISSLFTSDSTSADICAKDVHLKINIWVGKCKKASF